MVPGEWKELPGQIPLWSDAELGEIQALHGGHDIKGYSGSKSVIYAWTGSAFDGHRWWFFGGGMQITGVMRFINMILANSNGLG